MLNLLNREKRYFIRKEYLNRLLNVLLSVLIFCLVYYGVLIFSNTFLVNFEKRIVDEEKKLLNESIVQKDLKEFEEALTHLESEYKLFSKNIFYPSEIVSIINQKNISGINLVSIDFNKVDEEGNFKLAIKGVAQNREILLNYNNSLKAEKMFKSVTVPISSLARNADIPFDLIIDVKIDKENEK